MKAAKTKQEILEKIEILKNQIAFIGLQIEKDRKENDDDDSAVLHELLDKKDFLEQTVNGLLDSLKNSDLPEHFGQRFKVNINGNTREFWVVHPTQADSQNGRISIDSPIAQALEGNRVGDQVEIETPAGTQIIQILEVNK
mgnify:CR=1 FL=1